MKKTGKRLTMNASLLRIILLVLLAIVTIGGIFGSTYGIDMLKKYAVEVSHKKVDAVASNGTIQALKTTEQELNQNRDVLEKIGLLKSKAQFPEFQVVDEVRAIAAKNNIQIESFTYGNEADTGATTGSAPATTTPTTGVQASSGKTIALTVTPKNASYLDFLQFTYDIEQHVPKMKIQGISVKASSDGPGVSIDPIVVEMYIL